jgi:Zn-dependent protease with chaperone function
MASTVWTASGALLAGVATFVPVAGAAGAQVAIKRGPAGFNLFTVQQDADIGRQAATEIERRVALVTSARTAQFLGSITAVVAQASGAKVPFQVKAVNSGDVNLLVLPGGQIYVTRGLLSQAKSEAEVAAVLAHAMAHVVLRHGTARASKAYLSKAGLSALGGLGRSGAVERIVNTVGGFGMNAAFLAFARSDEYEADALGAEFLSSAGYDPVAMANVFATLRREKTRLPAIERFHAAHPPAADRESRIRNLSNVLRHGRAEIVGGFSRMRWRGGPTSTVANAPEVKTSSGTVAIRTTASIPDIPAPSPQFTRFTDPDAVVTIDHPSNWDTYQSGAAMSFVPAGGVVEREDGAPSLVQGLIVNQYEPFEDDVERWNNSLTRHYAPFEDRSRPRGALEDATDDLVRQIMSANTWLTAPTRSARSEVVDGLRGYSVRLSGRSPITGKTERVTLYTRALPDDHIIYMACVAAGRTVSSVERACSRMVQSLRINDSSLHRQQRH